MIVATHDGKKALDLLSTAEDIARFKHIDLTQASKMLTMAMTGSQRATKQLGLSVQAVTTQQDAAYAAHKKQIEALQAQEKAAGKLTDSQKEQYQAQKDQIDLDYKAAKANAVLQDHMVTGQKVIELTTQKLHGQAQAYSETAAGAHERFTASMDELQVQLGKMLLPAITRVTDAMAGLAEFFTKHTALAKILIAGIAGITAVVVPLIAAVKAWSVAQAALDVVLTANPIGAIIIGLVALGAALVVAWKKSETFRDIVKGTWDAVKTAGSTLVQFVTVTIPAAFQTALNWVRQHWPEIATLLAGPFAPLVALATDGFGIRSRFEAALTGMKNFAASIIGNIAGFFGDLPGRIGGAIGDGAKKIKDAVLKVFDVLPGFVRDVLKIHSPSGVFEDIGSAVVQGFIKGIEGKAGALLAKARDLASSVTGHISGAVGAFHGGTSDLSGNRLLGQKMAKAYGWGGGNQWFALDQLWQGESGWNSEAVNASSGAAGIPQALPASKMGIAAVPRALGGGGDAAAQIAWGLNYIKGRYGTPAGAWAAWLSRSPHWYDQGGWLQPGLTLAMNTTGRPERVISHNGGDGGPLVVIENYNQHTGTDVQSIGTTLGRLVAR